MKKHPLLLLLSVLLTQLASQNNPYWMAGGNPNFGTDFVNGTNNILGTQAGNTTTFSIRTNGQERMRINHNATAFMLPSTYTLFSAPNPYPNTILTRIGISVNGTQPITEPLSVLHIGHDFAGGGVQGGFRDWMNIGTIYVINSDNFFTGLRAKDSPLDPTGRTSLFTGVPTDDNDAVISWGDNTSPPNLSPNNLTFIFGAPRTATATGPGSSYGQEIARMIPNGNVGIGPQFFDNAQPQNMLHLNSEATSSVAIQITNAGFTGQTFTDGFHIGITGGGGPGGGIAELRQRENRDMRFFTNNIQRIVIANGNANAGGRVGINTNTPANRLEITSNPADPQPSGLRLTNLTSTSVPVANPGLGVLSTNSLGDVIYVPGGGSSTANNGVSTTAGGVIQLGVPCTLPGGGDNSPAIAANGFTTSRVVYIPDHNLWFATLKTHTSGVGIGGQPPGGAGPYTWCNVRNTLELSANSASKYGFTNASGLRLTNLTSTNVSTPLGGPFGVTNLKLLSVDNEGDVVMVDAPTLTASTIGNYCVPGPSNPLTGDYEIPLGSFKFRFTGQSIIQQTAGVQADMVSIGYPCGVGLPVAKLNVLEQQTVATVPFDNYSGYFRNLNNGTSSNSVLCGGVYGESKGVTFPSLNDPLNAGGVFEGLNAAFNVGVIGRIAKMSTPRKFTAAGGYAIGGAFMSDSIACNSIGMVPDNYGVYGRAINSITKNYGVYGEVRKTNPTATNYAIFGETNIGSYVPGFPTPSTSVTYAGYFNGDVYIAGLYGPSDASLKQNFDSIPNAIGIIKQLKPKTFDYNLPAFPSMGLPNGLQYGLIAQDVQTVIPAIVIDNVHPAKYDDNGNLLAAQVNFKGLEYQQLIPIIIRAMQQQQKHIEKQDSLIQVLTQNINECCENQQAKQTGINGNGKNAQQQVLNQMNIDLSDKDVIVLNQNIPNPYAEHTTITYNVPIQFKYAQMIFKTIDGRIIKTTDLEKGKGQLNVFASDLSNGLYMYTLIVDGKEFDTKKMVKQN